MAEVRTALAAKNKVRLVVAAQRVKRLSWHGVLLALGQQQEPQKAMVGDMLRTEDPKLDRILNLSCKKVELNVHGDLPVFCSS